MADPEMIDGRKRCEGCGGKGNPNGFRLCLACVKVTCSHGVRVDDDTRECEACISDRHVHRTGQTERTMHCAGCGKEHAASECEACIVYHQAIQPGISSKAKLPATGSDALAATLTPEEFCGFCKGSALECLLRIGDTGDPREDAAKAVWYLERLRKALASEHTVAVFQQELEDARADLAKRSGCE